tara:strand:+ start:650 stop:991 length:342 start_codon:yes stop_codon:yes gene_type:complete
MQKPNFKCPKTDKEFFIPTHKISFNTLGEKVYKDKYNQVLINPDNGELLVEIEREFNGFCTSVHGSKAEQKQKMVKHLKNRSKQHYKKEIAPTKMKQVADEVKRMENSLTKKD